MADGHISPTRILHQCKHCGEGFYPKRTDRLQYCSRQCWNKAWRPPGKPITKHPFRRVWFRDCTTCGTNFAAKVPKAIYCSQPCFLIGQSDKSFAARPCAECGKEFSPVYGVKRRTYCSAECCDRATMRTSRKAGKARKRAATVEPVNPTVVFDRDGWRCQLCHKPTPRRYRGTYHMRAPELDHIIPLSQGGEHSYRNTQCACRECNGKKGATPLGQLRLIA